MKTISVIISGMFLLITGGCSGKSASKKTPESAEQKNVGYLKEEGTCLNPINLDLNTQVSGFTKGKKNYLQGSCLPGKAPEMVYVFEVKEPISLDAEMDADFDGGIYLLKDCASDAEEIACSDDNDTKNKSRILVPLNPGRYFFVVDGFGEESGSFTLKTSVKPGQKLSDLCLNAQKLEAGKWFEGTTEGNMNSFGASCAENAMGPDVLYKFALSEYSRVRLLLETPSFDGVLHFYRGCPPEGIEIACNDDFENNQSSMIRDNLPEGEYFLVVDGFSATDSGNYRIKMDVFSSETTSSNDDKCENAPLIQISPGNDDRVIQWEGSTFWANDDFMPSCAGSQGGPDIFRKFHLEKESIVSMEVSYSQFPGVLFSIYKNCRGDEIACQIDGIRTHLPRGDYWIGIDSDGIDFTGDFKINMRVQNVESLDKICFNSPSISIGKIVEAKTEGGSRFNSSCGGGGKGPENIHKISIAKDEQIRVEVNSKDFDSVVYIRRSCIEEASEIACNDDSGGAGQSVVEAKLAKGVYYIFVDGFSENDSGKYNIKITGK